MNIWAEATCICTIMLVSTIYGIILTDKTGLTWKHLSLSLNADEIEITYQLMIDMGINHLKK